VILWILNGLQLGAILVILFLAIRQFGISRESESLRQHLADLTNKRLVRIEKHLFGSAPDDDAASSPDVGAPVFRDFRGFP
jgi:hypothetical protein